MATAKHFAVHGQPEGGTNTAPGNYSERIIRENFLVPFQAAVQEAHVGSVMASYNEIDGVPSHINHWLLDKVLRQEWGFNGYLVSDGEGLQMLVIRIMWPTYRGCGAPGLARALTTISSDGTDLQHARRPGEARTGADERSRSRGGARAGGQVPAGSVRSSVCRSGCTRSA